MSIKFLVLGGGGVFWVLGGGGSADFIFMGARIFLTLNYEAKREPQRRFGYVPLRARPVANVVANMHKEHPRERTDLEPHEHNEIDDPTHPALGGKHRNRKREGKKTIPGANVAELSGRAIRNANPGDRFARIDPQKENLFS